MVIAAIIVGAGVFVELLAILKAPLGYQDDTGFHVGASGAENEEGQPWLNPS
ncbi:MAG TPA: hypothetical protein VG754_09005 [Verrucomicrobiae bacterium]|jgi:hypothetical protein|nr:hypothetical protein [Verrucomicrobiae bacterium]